MGFDASAKRVFSSFRLIFRAGEQGRLVETLIQSVSCVKSEAGAPLDFKRNGRQPTHFFRALKIFA